MVALWIVVGILTAIVLLLLYVVVRLNKYIAALEGTWESQVDRVDNLQDSMQRALKENLFKDGTLKKPLIGVDEMQ